MVAGILAMQAMKLPTPPQSPSPLLAVLFPDLVISVYGADIVAVLAIDACVFCK